MAFYNWDKIEWETVEAGIKRKIITGENLMVVLYEIGSGKGLKEHTHPHEQFVYIFKGKAEFTVDGEKAIVGPGGVVHVPPDVPHGGKVVSDEPLLELDVFYPIRRDFLKKEK